MQPRPVSSDDRVLELDVLRGVAILGMWIVNMTVDVGWWYRIELMPMALSDFATTTVVNLLFSGKFFTIFSFLYGVGVFVQVERAQARGTNAVHFHLRRSLGLLLIASVGIAATLHPWILVKYALFGVALLPLVSKPPRVILVSAIATLALSIGTGRILPGVAEYAELEAGARDRGISLEAEIARAADETAALAVQREATIRARGFWATSRRSIAVAWAAHTSWSHYAEGLGTLGLMLLGLAAARTGSVWDADARRSLARRTLPWLIGGGGACATIAVVMNDLGFGDDLSLPQRILWATLQGPVGSGALGLGYVSALVLSLDHPSWRRRLRWFAPVGRMALTSYLLTLLVSACLTLGWGLGLFGQLMPAESLLVVAVGFPLLGTFSGWWLRRFRFGPIEWAWRCLTYGEPQPLRRA